MASTVRVRAACPERAERLLGRVGPADAATRRAIELALSRGSTDPALHAAALLVAHLDRDDLRLARSKAKRWVLGLDELVDRGHVDAAAFAAPRLAAAYPNIPYLASMGLVFRRLPAAAGGARAPFTDDLARDVQIVPMPGSDTLLRGLLRWSAQAQPAARSHGPMVCEARLPHRVPA